MFSRHFFVKTIFINLLLVCGLYNWSYSHPIVAEGTVVDAQTDQPVSFATLGVKSKNIGTIADENGAFRFLLGAEVVSMEETVVVSCIGYISASIPISKFNNAKQQVRLIPSSITLSSVTIKPDKYKTVVFGRTGSSTIMTGNMFTERNLVADNLGKEQAAILSVDKHCYLRDFNMLVVFNRFKSVKFRLNFYNVKDGQPDKLIVDKDILFDVTRKNGWQKVDLAPYHIYLDGYKEIAVAIQWVKSVKADSVVQPAFGVSVTPVPFHAIYFRNKSQADWKEISPAYVAYNITADSFKPGKKKDDSYEGPIRPEASPVMTDSLSNYISYARLEQEAAASGYGRNRSIGKYVHLPDANLYYEIYGSGQPLLLLHGNGLSISSFYKQIPELSRHYQVIAVDTRGHGKSTDASIAPLTYDKFALDMKQLLDSLHIKQTSILGWSDGGNTGLIMAARYPAYVNKLITMGAVASPDGIEPGLLNQFKVSLNEISHKEGTATNTGQRLLTLLVTEPKIDDLELESIKASVLVIAGQKDAVRPEHTKQISDHIKHSKLLIINGATHYAPQEKPKEFNSSILEFLDQ